MIKDHLILFGTDKTPIEVNKEKLFGGTYFRDIYFGVKPKLLYSTENQGQNLMSWKILTKNNIAQIIMTLASINIKLNAKRC